MVQDQLAKRMLPTKRQAGRPRDGGRAVIPTVDNRGLAVLQLNVEGLTTAKLEVVRHLADSNGAAAVLLQETHCTSDNFLKIPGFHLAGSIHSKQHGVATFVRTEISWSTSSQSPPGSNIEWLVTKIQETSVINVYKPPPLELSATSLPGSIG
ncbi:Homocitrate dehydratase mitochondrial [Dissostichus eleginoides]|uniref:Homocitrate dehydratase mitochondrial n=1 Tax=Dissostichus eleginoides TaxID=100907 RepID=A0AAD9F880_DISEL|nr:Homocitrate dehydratase mitochondrial [Dissostichus eleginoides]